MRRRSLIIAATVLFWAGMTGWLVLSEVLPGALSRLSPGYKGLLSDGYLIADNWMKVSIGDRKIGYSHTTVDTAEEDPVNRYRIQNETELDVTVMGQPLKVDVTAEAALDALYQLQNFSFLMSSKDYTMKVDGHRKREETFEVHLRTAGSVSQLEVQIPDDAVIYSPMMALQLKQLKPGQTLRLKTFDPLSMATTEVVVNALRRATLQHRGAARETTVLSVETEGLEVLTWIDTEGVILRQETPFGWVLEECDPQEAMARERGGGEAGDILLALAVPVNRPIPEARRRGVLRIRLVGPGLRPEELTSSRQTVDESAGGSAVLTLKADALPTESPATADIRGGFEAFRVSSPFVQTDDPEIVRRAREIVGGETNSLKAALLLYEWVHTHVRKAPALSVPSAKAVLEVMSGDCNEHTYLFVALARAAGLPARIFVGLTYSEGAFYYHAWPAVYVGRWLEMDPTLGQPAVDATHLKLLEGELKDQMKLMTFIGRLKIEVLDD